MTAALGVELGVRTLRAVRVEGRRAPRTRVLEVPCDPERPEDAVRALHEGLGGARRVGVAVALPLLLAKRVHLPPLPAAERRRLLRLEPQRFFAVRLEDLVVSVRDDELVFATREAPLSAWVRAIETLGPVELVEPGPVSLARGLARAGVTNGVVVLDEVERGLGVVALRGGTVALARRVYGGIAEAAAALDRRGGVDEGAGTPTPSVYVAPWEEGHVAAIRAHAAGAAVVPLPTADDVPATFLSAYGAALGAALGAAAVAGRDLAGTLVPDDLAARIAARRRRANAAGALAVAATVLFAAASLDAWRARATRELAERVAALERRAAPAAALEREFAVLERQTAALQHVRAQRGDPLDVLRAISGRLPPGAYLRSLRATGLAWQLDGYALQAARVLEGLSQEPAFRDVHFLSATNRVQIDERDHESFSVAFRVAPAP